MSQFKSLRLKMVQEQIVARGVRDPHVLQAMESIPREHFVGKEASKFAYEDRPLPIKEGQTISQPYIVALMAEKAQITPEDNVLEIGTGSGYSAAVLSRLAAHVFSVERHLKLAKTAQQRLKKLKLTNVTICPGDGTLGWEECAPYNAIIVTAGAPQIPQPLLHQLSIGGRLIIPVGQSLESQQLVRVIRKDEKNYTYEGMGAVRFVPLVGQEGWNLDVSK